MKTLKLLAAIAATTMMSACSQEDMLLPENNHTATEETSTRVSLGEALKKADRMLARIGDSATRTRTRAVKSVEFIGGGGTRANGDSPLYYVVNYEDEGGFAVLGADTRLDGVYAISDQGHLDMNDTTFNFGLNVFFRSLPVNPTFPDTLQIDPQPFQPGPEPVKDISYGRGPFLTPEVRKWSQGYPYNTFCPTKTVKVQDSASGNYYFDQKLCVVGCVNVAVGQIMSFYECPKTYGRHTFNWTEMKQWQPVHNYNLPLLYEPAPESGVARLLRELGTEGNFNTSYGINSSGTYTKQYYKRTFKTFEYKEPGDFKTFSTDDLVYWTYNKEKPVLVIGRNDNDEGHCWVIDGMYCDMTYYKDILGREIYRGEGLLFHVVWGWGGHCNGYFKHGSGFTELSTKITNPQDNTTMPSNWQDMVKIYHLEFCGDISPR